ncbi:NAD(P)-dependent oxidoreductase [Desulfovibrio sp. OttesenSCG-928-C14]|nr:NAD(P)-dependent oxidoreductase [Desulfovibrio sp. OttesenSCG-928-C14]
MMNILIIGSTSSVARAIGRSLSCPHNVHYAGRRNADYFFDMESRDLGAFDGVRADVIIYAANDFGGPSEEDFFRSMDNNLSGILQVLKLAKQVNAGKTVIFSSLFAAYKPGFPLYNAYSVSKKVTDSIASLYADLYAHELVILRPSQIYGTDPAFKKHQAFFYHILERAKNGDDISIYGQHDAIRNYIHIDDIVEIVKRVILKSFSGIYYCTSPRSVRLKKLAETAYSVFKTNGRIMFLSDKPDLPDLPCYSGKPLYDLIDYRPTVTLAEGIRRIKQSGEL